MTDKFDPMKDRPLESGQPYPEATRESRPHMSAEDVGQIALKKHGVVTFMNGRVIARPDAENWNRLYNTEGRLIKIRPGKMLLDYFSGLRGKAVAAKDKLRHNGG